MTQLTDLLLEILQLIRQFLLEINPLKTIQLDEWKKNCQSWRNFFSCSQSSLIMKEWKKHLIYYDLNTIISADYLRFRVKDPQKQRSVSMTVAKIQDRIIYERNQISLTCRHLRSIYLPSQLPPVHTLFLSQDEIQTLQPYHLIRQIIILNGHRIHHSGKLTHTHSLFTSNLRNLPEDLSSSSSFSFLQEINFSGCDKIIDGVYFQKVKRVNLSHCKELRNVSMLGDVHEINISYCPLIENISDLYKVYKLMIDGCQKVVDIRSLQQVKILSMCGLTQLQNVFPPDQHEVIHLTITEDMIETIQSVHQTISQLVIHGSNQPRGREKNAALPEPLAHIRQLTLDNSFRITSLKHFHFLTKLVIRNELPTLSLLSIQSLPSLHTLILTNNRSLKQLYLQQSTKTLQKIFLQELKEFAALYLFHEIEIIDMKDCLKMKTIYCFQELPKLITTDSHSCKYTICQVNTQSSLLNK